MATLATDIEEIIRSIWSTLFELSIRTNGDQQLDGEAQVTSVVHIDGAWHGAVMMQSPLQLAATLTAGMFKADSPPSFDDIRDALGELTNMLAGNLKALLPEPCAISLPAVAVGSDYNMAVVGSTVVARVPFICDGQPLVVTLVERSDKDDPVP